VFAGISTGAALAGAAKCASSLPAGESASIVVVSADGGWKYLSTGAWTDDLDEVAERAKGIIYF
jgi:cysteine synthase B